MRDRISTMPDRTLIELAGILAQYRSTDNRAIYVGVTGADLFSGDTNYIFGTGIAANGITSLVSYYRMTTKSTGERYEFPQAPNRTTCQTVGPTDPRRSRDRAARGSD